MRATRILRIDDTNPERPSGRAPASAVRVGPLRCVTLASLLLAALPAANQASAQLVPATAIRGLSPFDARWELIRRFGATIAPPASAMKRLEAESPGVRIDWDPILRTARFLRNTERPLREPAPVAFGARDAIAAFAADYGDLLGVTPDELSRPQDFEVVRDATSAATGLHHLIFKQKRDGIEIFDAELRANFGRRGELLTVGSTWVSAATPVAPQPPTLDALAALKAAAAHCAVGLSEEPEEISRADGPDNARSWRCATSLRSDEPASARTIYFPTLRANPAGDVAAAELRRAWLVTLPTRGVGHTYDVVVDAADGSLLHRANRLVWDTTQPVTTRVFTGDSPAPGTPGTDTPAAFQYPVVARELITVTPAEISPFSPNGWINDNQSDTIGNNAAAQLDRDGNNSPDLPRPNGGVGRVFDPPLDLNLAPNAATNGQAAVVQAFYLANRFHDAMYRLGFTETFANFQTTNFGRGGAAGDAVQVDVQDGAARNNANFVTGNADGSSARAQMFIFDGPTPDRDSGLDSEIVYHELAHGLSIRLHGGLFGQQPMGLGEGWSDFFALCLLSRSTDDPNAVYPFGAYSGYRFAGAPFESNYYFGIRRFPYSTDLSRNPLTFGDIDSNRFSIPPGVPISLNVATTNPAESHNVGEVWCSMLWDARANLIRRYGWSGNDLIQRLVVAAMKLSGQNPSFVTARDAVLSADLAISGGANHRELWDAFARRGLGVGAIGPPSSTTAGVTESFARPERVAFTFPNGLPEDVRPGISWSANVLVRGINCTPVDSTGIVYYSINGGPFVAIAMPPVNPGEYTAILPGVGCRDAVRYYFSVNTDAGPRTSPESAPLSTYVAYGLSGGDVLLDDNFEADRGWTVSGSATSGHWVRVDPNPTIAQPDDDHTADGTVCYVTGQAPLNSTNPSEADVDNGSTILTSPAFFTLGAPDIDVTYWAWFSNFIGAFPNEDIMSLEVSSDEGASWRAADVLGPATDNTGGWVYRSVRLSTVPGFVLGQTLRVRFTVTDGGNASLVEGAVDDVRVLRVPCLPVCVADVDNGTAAGTPDGGVTVEDLLYYLDTYQFGLSAADVDDGTVTGTPDGGVGIEDLLYYLIRYDSGC